MPSVGRLAPRERTRKDSLMEYDPPGYAMASAIGDLTPIGDLSSNQY